MKKIMVLLLALVLACTMMGTSFAPAFAADETSGTNFAQATCDKLGYTKFDSESGNETTEFGTMTWGNKTLNWTIEAGYTVDFCIKSGSKTGDGTKITEVKGQTGDGSKTIEQGISHVGYKITDNNPPTDVCPNISGDQATVPDGMVVDENGNCVTPPPTEAKTELCHATGSASNPFVLIEVSVSGAYNGHLGNGHQNGEDIIPPFQYDSNGDGTPETYSQNWDAEGQAIFNNGCEADEEPPVLTGSTYAFAVQGTCDAPGYIQINYTKGVDWTIEGEAVTVTAPSSRFTYPNGIQAEVKATAQDGYEIPSGQQSTYFLQVNPQPSGEDCEPPVDVCPNIEGNQSEVPDGMVVNDNGNCVVPQPPICKDECKMPYVKNDAPKVTKCTGVISNEVLNHVRVPKGKSCTLVDSYLNGNLTTDGARNVTVASTPVRKNINLNHVSGDVEFGSKVNACKYDPKVGGTFTVRNSHNVLICKAVVCDDIIIKNNDGKITIRASKARKVFILGNNEFVADGKAEHRNEDWIRLINVKGKKVIEGNAPRKVYQR